MQHAVVNMSSVRDQADLPTEGSVFANLEFSSHEQIAFCHDAESGLKAIIAVHDSTLGPALGGCRMWPYASEADALRDALRLSRGMTYKNAVAGLDLGGGKAVIIADSRKDKTPALIKAFARAVDKLGGSYITAEDVGISQDDAELMATETDHVRGTSKAGLGDPSPYTALGVFAGVKATAKAALGADSLTGLRVCVQGLGHVGMSLAEFLHDAGAVLTVADIFEPSVNEAVERFNAQRISPEEAHVAACDIYAPCALGAVLNETTIPQIKAKAVAGAANNQLATPADGGKLAARDILYAPDYVINAGGVISIGAVDEAPTAEAMRARVAELEPLLLRIFERARAENITPEIIADRMAEERIAAYRKS